MTALRCPRCGSTDVWCEETPTVHRHGCNACHLVSTFKGQKEPEQ